jgi:hypothetical protein
MLCSAFSFCNDYKRVIDHESKGKM